MTQGNQTKTVLVLGVTQLSQGGGYGEFDDPQIVAAASEGFCPYRSHDGKDTPLGSFRVEVQPDGTVICPGPPHPRHMKWEWWEE